MNKKVNILKSTSFRMTLSVFTFLCLIAGYAYAYGSFRIDSTTDESSVESTIGSRPIFISDAGENINLNVQVTAVLGDNLGVGTVLATSNSDVKISLSNNYTTGSTCSYDVSWQWIVSSPYDQYTKTTGSDKELTISGSMNNTALFTDTQITSYSSSSPKILLYSGSISNTGGNIQNQTIDITTSFYKTSNSQVAHMGKKYAGKIVVDNVSCAMAS